MVWWWGWCQSGPQVQTLSGWTEGSAAGGEGPTGPGRGGTWTPLGRRALSPAFAQAGGRVVGGESVQTAEGKVRDHGVGPGQTLPEGCLLSATCGVPASF